ncbi:MAG: hypothetical protein U0271_12380 [Polyangiaceae bacterium]
MGSFSYYATGEESTAILKEILARHGVSLLVPGGSGEHALEARDAVDDELAAWTRGPEIWLRGTFSLGSPGLATREDATGKRVVADMSKGGPVIAFEASLARSGVIRRGFVWFEENRDDWQLVEPTFAAIVATMKELLIHHELWGSRGWLSKGAIDVIEKGELRPAMWGALIDLGAPARVNRAVNRWEAAPDAEDATAADVVTRAPDAVRRRAMIQAPPAPEPKPPASDRTFAFNRIVRQLQRGPWTALDPSISIAVRTAFGTHSVTFYDSRVVIEEPCVIVPEGAALAPDSTDPRRVETFTAEHQLAVLGPYLPVELADLLRANGDNPDPLVRVTLRAKTDFAEARLSRADVSQSRPLQRLMRFAAITTEELRRAATPHAASHLGKTVRTSLERLALGGRERLTLSAFRRDSATVMRSLWVDSTGSVFTEGLTLPAHRHLRPTELRKLCAALLDLGFPDSVKLPEPFDPSSLPRVGVGVAGFDEDGRGFAPHVAIARSQLAEAPELHAVLELFQQIGPVLFDPSSALAPGSAHV